MAEQAAKQEQGKTEAKVERPQVRKVRFTAPVFLDQERSELEMEGNWQRATKAAVEVFPGKGVMVRYTPGKPGAGTENVWVPEGMVKQVHVAPEWKP